MGRERGRISKTVRDGGGRGKQREAGFWQLLISRIFRYKTQVFLKIYL